MEHTIEADRSDSALDMRLRPVGIVRSPLKQPSLVPRQGDLHWGAGVERSHEERSTVAHPVIVADWMAQVEREFGGRPPRSGPERGTE